MTSTKAPTEPVAFLRVGKHRLDALTDGVFAIVMTLLVLELKIPDLARGAPVKEIGSALVHEGPVFFSFLITFMFAAVFWYLHQGLLNFVRELRGSLVVLNLGFLLFVSLLPFSVGMLGHFLQSPLAQTLYFLNQLAISLLLFAMWWSARSSKLVLEPDGREARKFSIRVTAIPLAASLATGIAWVNPRASFYAFMLVMIASRVYTIRRFGRD